MTSMKKITDGGANWLGDLASVLMPPKDPATAGDCLGLNAIGLVGVSCDAVSNFVCQAPDPGGVSKPTTSALRFFPNKYSPKNANCH
jgi:hypothetical protein